MWKRMRNSSVLMLRCRNPVDIAEIYGDAENYGDSNRIKLTRPPPVPPLSYAYDPAGNRTMVQWRDGSSQVICLAKQGRVFGKRPCAFSDIF